jgi:hypothetical protein
MNWGTRDTIPRSNNVGPTFLKVCEALEGMTRQDARRVIRGAWVALGLDEDDPVAGPDAERKPDPVQPEGDDT